MTLYLVSSQPSLLNMLLFYHYLAKDVLVSDCAVSFAKTNKIFKTKYFYGFSFKTNGVVTFKVLTATVL